MAMHLCGNCGERVDIPYEKIKTDMDFIRVECSCGIKFILGNGVSYVPMDGEQVSEFLKKFLLLSPTLMWVADELVTMARLNRWEKFHQIVTKYKQKIQNNAPLVNFLIVNGLYL